MIRHGDGKAGQYAKGEAQRHYNRLMNLILLTTGTAGVLGGLGLGAASLPFVFKYIAWTRRVPLATYVAVFVGLEVFAIATITLIRRQLQGPLDRITRDRIRYLRGAQGEALVAYTLGALSDQWHLFNGIKMKSNPDIDHVLVGPGGLFCISTKSNRGTYTRAGDRIFLNGRLNDDVTEAQQLAMKLRSWLEIQLQHDDKVRTIPYVRPVLAAPLAFIDFPHKALNVWVMNEPLLSEDELQDQYKLPPATVAGCVAALQGLVGKPDKTINQVDRL